MTLKEYSTIVHRLNDMVQTARKRADSEVPPALAEVFMEVAKLQRELWAMTDNGHVIELPEEMAPWHPEVDESAIRDVLESIGMPEPEDSPAALYTRMDDGEYIEVWACYAFPPRNNSAVNRIWPKPTE